MMKPTQENYYRITEYMSASQFKAFMNCEACALAEHDGEHVRKHRRRWCRASTSTHTSPATWKSSGACTRSFSRKTAN